jgi:hypothetical protein
MTTIVLPRQARDRHRESSTQTRDVFLAGCACPACVPPSTKKCTVYPSADPGRNCSCNAPPPPPPAPPPPPLSKNPCIRFGHAVSTAQLYIISTRYRYGPRYSSSIIHNWHCLVMLVGGPVSRSVRRLSCTRVRLFILSF